MVFYSTLFFSAFLVLYFALNPESCAHLPMSLLYAVCFLSSVFVLPLKCLCVMHMSSPDTAEQIYQWV